MFVVILVLFFSEATHNCQLITTARWTEVTGVRRRSSHNKGESWWGFWNKTHMIMIIWFPPQHITHHLHNHHILDHNLYNRSEVLVTPVFTSALGSWSKALVGLEKKKASWVARSPAPSLPPESFSEVTRCQWVAFDPRNWTYPPVPWIERSITDGS